MRDLTDKRRGRRFIRSMWKGFLKKARLTGATAHLKNLKKDGRSLYQKGRNQNMTGDAVRFKTPKEGKTVFTDLLREEVIFDNSELDDLIILRSDKTPTYNFCVVVDDATMNITHVIRGDDHLANTPRQIHLYRGLGYPLPQFAHLSMILGADKSRLSKRHGATSILSYRDMGYLPEAMVNYLVRLGWSHGEQEIFSRDELIKYFSLENINKSAAVFNPEKLLWVNSHYIKTENPLRLAKELKPLLIAEKLIIDDSSVKDEEIAKVIPLLQERSKTLVEMAKRS